MANRPQRPNMRRGRGVDAILGDAAAPPQASTPAPRRESTKVTFYVWRDQLHDLERKRLERILAGQRAVNISDLVREALDAYLAGQER